MECDWLLIMQCDWLLIMQCDWLFDVCDLFDRVDIMPPCACACACACVGCVEMFSKYNRLSLIRSLKGNRKVVRITGGSNN